MPQDYSHRTGEGTHLTGERNEQGQSLKIPQIFAGEDVVLGPSTVAKACFDGQRGARNIHRYLESL